MIHVKTIFLSIALGALIWVPILLTCNDDNSLPLYHDRHHFCFLVAPSTFIGKEGDKGNPLELVRLYRVLKEHPSNQQVPTIILIEEENLPYPDTTAPHDVPLRTYSISTKVPPSRWPTRFELTKDNERGPAYTDFNPKYSTSKEALAAYEQRRATAHTQHQKMMETHHAREIGDNTRWERLIAAGCKLTVPLHQMRDP